jgi:hypothetical protein
MKKKIHEINQKKNHKVKKKFFELSDEFFSEKIGEVSFNKLIIYFLFFKIIVKRKNKR